MANLTPQHPLSLSWPWMITWPAEPGEVAGVLVDPEKDGGKTKELTSEMHSHRPGDKAATG